MKALLFLIITFQLLQSTSAETLICTGKTNDINRTELAFELELKSKKDVISKRFFYHSNLTFTLSDGKHLIHGIDLNFAVKKKQAQLIYTGSIESNTLTVSFDDAGNVTETVLNYPNSGITNVKTSCDISGKLPDRPICSEDIDKNLALLTAIRSDAGTDAIEFAISCGADVNFADENDCTPIMKAIDGGCGIEGVRYISPVRNYIKIIDTLINNGAYADTKDKNGETPLIKAAKGGLRDVYTSFIAAESNFDAADKTSMTPLMYAAMTGDSTVVEQVLAGNPDRRIKNIEGKTAFDLAVHWQKEDVIDLLRIPDTSVSIEGKDDGSCSPLEINLKEGQVVEVKLKATAKMFKLDSVKLGLDLMADRNSSDTQIFTADKKGSFAFTCGFHGSNALQGIINIK